MALSRVTDQKGKTTIQLEKVEEFYIPYHISDWNELASLKDICIYTEEVPS